MQFSKLYPAWVKDGECTHRTLRAVDQIICWLTGHTPAGLQEQIGGDADLQTFFAKAPAHS